MPTALTPDQLLELYKIAIEEYRFEVKLNWERSMYYLTFNTAVLTISAGLIKLGNTGRLNVFIAALFVIGFATSIFAIIAIRKAHEYYHRTIVKKTIIEDQLGLNVPLPDNGGTLAVGTTIGQTERNQILDDAEHWIKKGLLRPGSIIFFLALLLMLIGIADLLGAYTAILLCDFGRPLPLPWTDWL